MEGKPVSGLTEFDIEQAKKMFDNKGNKIADSVNQAEGKDFFGRPIAEVKQTTVSKPLVEIASVEVDNIVDKYLPDEDDEVLEVFDSTDSTVITDPFPTTSFPTAASSQIDLSKTFTPDASPTVQTDMVGGTINQDRTQEDLIEEQRAAAKEAARKAARDRRKKRKKTQKQNEDFTARKIKEYQETGRVTGFKEGGLASRKK